MEASLISAHLLPVSSVLLKSASGFPASISMRYLEVILVLISEAAQE